MISRKIFSHCINSCFGNEKGWAKCSLLLDYLLHYYVVWTFENFILCLDGTWIFTMTLDMVVNYLVGHWNHANKPSLWGMPWNTKSYILYFVGNKNLYLIICWKNKIALVEKIKFSYSEREFNFLSFILLHHIQVHCKSTLNNPSK